MFVPAWGEKQQTPGDKLDAVQGTAVHMVPHSVLGLMYVTRPALLTTVAQARMVCARQHGCSHTGPVMLQDWILSILNHLFITVGPGAAGGAAALQALPYRHSLLHSWCLALHAILLHAHASLSLAHACTLNGPQFRVSCSICMAGMHLSACKLTCQIGCTRVLWYAGPEGCLSYEGSSPCVLPISCCTRGCSGPLYAPAPQSRGS